MTFCGQIVCHLFSMLGPTGVEQSDQQIRVRGLPRVALITSGVKMVHFKAKVAWITVHLMAKLTYRLPS